MRAEQYLRERRPAGYRFSATLERELEPLGREINRSYELEDPDAHEKAVARMVHLALKDYARYEGEANVQTAQRTVGNRGRTE